MSEDVKKEELPFTTEDRATDEGYEYTTLLNKEGEALFSVSRGYSEYQLKEIFALCDGHFQQGVRMGVQRMQADLKRILGVAEEAPAESPVE